MEKAPRKKINNAASKEKSLPKKAKKNNSDSSLGFVYFSLVLYTLF